jgi:hypothetical protein
MCWFKQNQDALYDFEKKLKKVINEQPFSFYNIIFWKYLPRSAVEVVEVSFEFAGDVLAVRDDFGILFIVTYVDEPSLSSSAVASAGMGTKRLMNKWNKHEYILIPSVYKHAHASIFQ